MTVFSKEDLRIGSYTGRIHTELVLRESFLWLEQIKERMFLPDAQLLAQGRNRNVKIQMPLANGPAEVVVKSFGGEGFYQQRRMRIVGSKARRTWQNAVYLVASGIGTPLPLVFLERWDHGVLLESYVVTLYQEGASSFAHELDYLYRHTPNAGMLMDLLDTVARSIRRMHDGGFLHNDLGNQNILLQRNGPGNWGNVQVIDLNRGRVYAELPDRERGRDLSRISLPSDFLRVFKEMYWGGQTVPPRAFHKWEAHYRRRFALHTATRRWRHPFRECNRCPGPGDPPEYPAPRDIWIWDPRSGQPLVTMVPKERSRYYPVSRTVQTVTASLATLPSAALQYARLLRQAFSQRVRMQGRIGVALEAPASDEERKLAVLTSLGTLPVLLRFYHHQGLAEVERTAAFAVKLVERGHALNVALVQDRRAVLEPESWRQFVDAVLERVGPMVDLVEAGHAINRVKWGVWNFQEYRRLMEPIAVWKNRLPRLTIGGPAMIDFEYPYIPAALNALPDSFAFDVLTHHLYVDRRGAPETPQGLFSALEKFALARALSVRAGNRLVITEFNWPLSGTGVYSPVGAPYVSPGIRRNDPSVTETEAAAYLIRYVLIALCSGLVERVFWWKLAAYGYGLVDDSDSRHWRERPAYQALKVLLEKLHDSVFTTRLEVNAEMPLHAHGILYCFEHADGAVWWMAYTLGEVCRIRRPKDDAVVWDAFGHRISSWSNRSETVELGMLPVYIE